MCFSSWHLRKARVRNAASDEYISMGTGTWKKTVMFSFLTTPFTCWALKKTCNTPQQLGQPAWKKHWHVTFQLPFGVEVWRYCIWFRPRVGMCFYAWTAPKVWNPRFSGFPSTRGRNASAIPQHSSHQQIKPSKFPLGPLGNSILKLYGQGSSALPVDWGRAWCEEYQERGHSRSWKLSQIVFNVSFFSPSGVVLLQWGDAGQAPMLTQKMGKKQTSANEIHTKWSCDGGRCYVWTLSFFNSSFH